MADILDQLAAEQDAEPTGAALVDLFDSFSQEQDQRQAGHDERLRLMFEAGLQKSPDQRAGILEVARQSRLPADVVEQKFPEFKARAEAAAFDPARFRAENPDLYQLFLENPEAGQIVVRDAKASQLARALVAVVTGRSPLEQAAGAESEVKLRDERRAAILAQQAAQYDPAVTEEQRKALEARRADVEGRIQAELDRTRPVAGIEESKAHLSAVEKVLGKATVAPKGWPMGGTPGGTEKAEQGVLGAAYGQGSLVVERGTLGREWARRVLTGGNTWEVEKKLVDVENRMVPRFYGDGDLTAILQATGELLPAQVESYKGAGVGAAAGALAGAAVGKAVPVIGVGKGAKAGARLGAKGGLWLTTFGLEQGNAAADYRDLKTDAGERVSPEVAVGWSVVYGVVSATIETGTELSKLGSWGPLGEMIRKGTLREEGKRLVRTPTFRRLLAQVARGYAGNIAKESGEEGLQQLAQEAIGYIARSQAAGAFQSPDVVGAVEAVSESLEKAATGSILPGAAGPIVNLTTQTIGQQRAKRGQDQLRAIMADVKEAPLAKASPDAYARLVELATERTGEAVTAIYVDPSAMTALFQDSETPGVSPEAAAAATELMGPDGPRRLQEALATGQKLEVPLAEFAERWRGKPIADALLDHVSAKPFLPTAAESAAQAEQREAEAQALVDSIEKGEKAATPEEAPLDQLAADLVTAGRMKPADAETDVRLWRKALNALAVRSGVELKDIVKSFVVRVRAEGGAPTATAQGAVPAAPAFWAAARETAQAKLDALRAEHGAEAESLPEWWKAQEDLQQAAAELARHDPQVVSAGSDQQPGGVPGPDAGGVTGLVAAKGGQPGPLSVGQVSAGGLQEGQQVVQRSDVVEGTHGGSVSPARTDLNRLEQGGAAARAVTANQAFRAWFGNSKVVDKKGRPLVVYHGTASDHEVFDPGHRHVSQGNASGMWFTMSRQYAWEYAQNATSHFDGKERIVEAYLRVENPLVVEFPDGDAPVVNGEVREWTSNKEVVDYAKKHGFDGVIWPSGSFTDAPSVVVFSAAQIKSATGNRGTFDPTNPSILEQATPAGPRGWVTRVQNGLRNLFNVVLTDRANLSTFLHESGHVFMDILGELASRPGASPQLVADWEAALKFMGVADRAELTERLSRVRQIRQQAVDAGRLEHGGAPALSDSEAAEVKALTAPFEKWARAFERYLMEGKAPSLELAGAFQRFKLWLRAIYRSIDALGVELNPEIRGVFDRLLATDEEIARAQEEMGPTSLFRSPEEAGLQDKPEEWAAYLERAKKAVSAAQQAARQRAASQRLAVTEAWWKAERKARRDAALEAYDALPAVVALRFLRKGEAGDNAALKALGKVKLDRAAVVALLGEEGAKKLRGILAAEGGIDPGTLAEIVAQGTTGAQLVQDIAGLQPKTEWAEVQADDAMAREFADVQTEREQLREAAGRALHGDAMLVWFLHEEQILRKRLAEAQGQTLQGMGAGSAGIPAESVRRAAEILVDRMTLERLDLGHYQGAERQAAQKAAVAAAKGDYGQALVYLQQRLLNFFAVRYLAEARDVRDGLLEEGKKAAKDSARARVGKGSPAIRDGIDRIVEELGLGPARQHDVPLATLSAAVDAVEASGVTVIFDPDALAAAVDRPPAVPKRRNGEPGAPWRGLTVAQAKNVLAALKNMRKAATSNLTALVDGQRMDFDELVARLLDEGQDNLPDRGAPTSSTMAGTLLQAAGGIVSGIDGELLRPETMLTWLGGKAAGIESWWYRAIVAPMQAAKVRESDLLRETVAPIVDAMEAIPAEVKRRMRDAVDGAALFPGHTRRIQPISRRYELIALALNIGNEGNLERLMEGRGITLAEVKRAVGLLTREELAYVQTCWDAAEKLGALAFEMEERLSGLAPEKVQAKPITIALADGTEVSLRGGYWPAVYDQRVEVKGERQAADMTMASEFLDPRFVRPGTNHNFLKSRVQGTTGILSLDPTIVQSHLVQVAHDVAFREAVLSVGKLFLSPEIQDVLKSRLGNERAKIFLDWVKDVARSRGAAAVSQARTHTNLGTRLRSNMAVGALGYAVDVVVGDLTNPAVAAVKFKNPLHLTAAIAECVAHPLETRRWAIQKSGELRVRADELVRRWKQHRNELTKRRFPGREAFDAYVEHAFDLFEMSDALTATPIWVGAYREGLQLFDGDDALAVEYADKLVRETFPTQSIVDQSAIQRDKGFWGAAMLFFGYLNTIFNLRRDIAHDAYQTFHDPEAGALDRAGAVAKAAWKWVAVVAAYQVLGEFLSGRGQEPDEKFTRWLLRKALVGLTVGDLPLGALAEPTISRIVTGKAKRVSVRAAPAVAVLQGAADSLSKALDGKGDAKEFFDVARSLGLLLGVPTRPLRAAEYVATKAGDDLQAGRLNELPAGVIYGERKNQPANPLRPVGGR